MSSQNNNNKLAIKFRCPGELEGLLPQPVPANLGVPDWLKAMPTTAFSALNQQDDETVKRCPPFIDAMTCGFLIPLICDIRVEDGEISWDNAASTQNATRRAAEMLQLIAATREYQFG